MMENIFILLLHLTTEFVNISLVYKTIFDATFTKRRKRAIGVVLAVVCTHVLWLFLYGIDDAMGLSFFTMLSIPFFLLDGRKRQSFFLYPFVVIMSSVFSCCMSFVLACFLGISESVILDNHYLTLLCQCTPFGIYLIWLSYRKKKKIFFEEMYLSVKQYVLLYTVAISEFFVLATLQSLSRDDNFWKTVTEIGVPISVTCVVLALITIWQGIVSKREIRLQEQNRLLEYYMELQKTYYTDLLTRDEELRRFRHDIDAHLLVLQAYGERSADADLRQYVEAMSRDVLQNRRKNYTGNHGVDALLFQFEKRAEKNGIVMTVEGVLPNQSEVEEYDLCILISNLLSNALEACECMSEQKVRYIQLKVGSYQDKLYISVENSTSVKVTVEGKRLYTTKTDKQNHGFGSENVARIVKKYGGVLEYQSNEHSFLAEICL